MMHKLTYFTYKSYISVFYIVIKIADFTTYKLSSVDFKGNTYIL